MALVIPGAKSINGPSTFISKINMQSHFSHTERGQREDNENLGKEKKRNGRRREERVAINAGCN
jgi:hypothetical protein